MYVCIYVCRNVHGHVGEEQRGLEEGEDEAGERRERPLVQQAPGGGEEPQAAAADEAEDGVDGCLWWVWVGVESVCRQA